jgi:hypothetical protein
MQPGRYRFKAGITWSKLILLIKCWSSISKKMSKKWWVILTISFLHFIAWLYLFLYILGIELSRGIDKINGPTIDQIVGFRLWEFYLFL